MICCFSNLESLDRDFRANAMTYSCRVTSRGSLTSTVEAACAVHYAQVSHHGGSRGGLPISNRGRLYRAANLYGLEAHKGLSRFLPGVFFFSHMVTGYVRGAVVEWLAHRATNQHR